MFREIFCLCSHWVWAWKTVPYAGRGFTQAVEIPQVCLNKELFLCLWLGSVGFFQPRLSPQVVAGVFPSVWTAAKMGLFRASKNLSLAFPQFCTAKSRSLTSAGTDRYLTQMKMPINSDLLSHSWLTQSPRAPPDRQEERKRTWVVLSVPSNPDDSVLAVTFCYPKPSWKVLQ